MATLKLTIFKAKVLKDNTTIGMMLSQIKAVINRNINSGSVRYEIHPFAYKKIPKSPIKELDIPLESLNMIRNSNPKEKKYIVARDVLCFLFISVE